MRYLFAGALPLSSGGSQDSVISWSPAVTVRLRGAPGGPSPNTGSLNTGPVGALVSVSSLPPSSVKDTRALTVLPTSEDTGV